MGNEEQANSTKQSSKSKYKSRYDLKIELIDESISQLKMDLSYIREQKEHDTDEEFSIYARLGQYEEEKEKVNKERSSIKGKINETIDRLRVRLREKCQPVTSIDTKSKHSTYTKSNGGQQR